MKSAVICFKCHIIKRFSDTYSLKILDTGDLVETVRPSKKNREEADVVFLPKTKVVRVCRTCVKRMGYKVKGGKKNEKVSK